MENKNIFDYIEIIFNMPYPQDFNNQDYFQKEVAKFR